MDHIKEFPRKATVVGELLQSKVMDMYEGMAEMDKDSEESKLNGKTYHTFVHRLSWT